jgi:hypothetical protein
MGGQEASFLNRAHENRPRPMHCDDAHENRATPAPAANATNIRTIPAMATAFLAARLGVFLRRRPNNDRQTAPLTRMDDFVVRSRRLHCDKADKAGLWRWRLRRLVHKVVTGYYLTLSANTDIYVVRQPSSESGRARVKAERLEYRARSIVRLWLQIQ